MAKKSYYIICLKCMGEFREIGRSFDAAVSAAAEAERKHLMCGGPFRVGLTDSDSVPEGKPVLWDASGTPVGWANVEPEPIIVELPGGRSLRIRFPLGSDGDEFPEPIIELGHFVGLN